MLYSDRVSAVRRDDWMYDGASCCTCLACGDTVYRGEKVYCTDEGYIHEECLKEFVMEEYSADELAEVLGFPATREASA